MTAIALLEAISGLIAEYFLELENWSLQVHDEWDNLNENPSLFLRP
jgi:hypothetical protein